MKKKFTVAVIAAILSPALLFSQAVTMVKDLTPGPASTVFQDLDRVKAQGGHDHFPSLVINGKYHFSANANGAAGGQLFRTDGTAAGTVLLASNPTFGPFKKLVRWRETVAFFGENENAPGYREDLFIYDGANAVSVETVGNCPTEAPAGYDRFNPIGWADKIWYRKLKCGTNAGADIWYEGPDTKMTNTTSYPHLLGGFGGQMFMVVGGTAAHPGGTQLWKANSFDNQPATFLKNINFNQPLRDYLPGISPGGNVGFLFIAENSAGNGQSIWKTTGTAAGTVELAPAFGYHRIISLGESAAYIGKDAAGRPTLMQTNGVTHTKLASVYLPDFSEDYQMALLGSSKTGKLIFANKQAPEGNEVFAYDFKKKTYGLVEDIHNNFQSQFQNGDSNPREFVKIGKTIFFTADNGFQGRELWSTDGTTLGTGMVEEIKVGPFGSNPEGLVRVNSTTLVFTADDGIHGRELWKLDVTKLRGNEDETADLETAADVFEVAPNPASEVLQIFSNSEKITGIQLFDIAGRFVRDIQVQGDVTVENIAGLTPGFYILKAKTVAGEMLSKKVLKN